MIRIDLHLHTTFSGDATISPKFLVDQLYAHPFIRGAAITDHNTLQGYEQTRRLAAAYEDVLIIPGIEISTEQGHITILGIEEKPEYPLAIDDITDFAKERNGLVIIPHPYRELTGIGELAETIQADAVEILNPHSTFRQNKMAEELARARKLPGVAGSDAHEPGEMWTAYTEVNAEQSVEAVVDAIRKGMVKVSSRLPFKY